MSQYDDDFDRWCQYGDDDEREGEVTCKFCGNGPFDWHHTGKRWVLLDDNGRVHYCRTASVDEFEDLS